MNTLDAMSLFVRVADLGSFAAVADHLGVTRSVFTRQIAALEKHLGVKLINRTTRKLTLTSAGIGYLTNCRTILELVDSAEAEVMEARLVPRGKLRVGMPLSFGLRRIVPLLPAFQSMYPEINLDLDITDRHINLIDESIDISIRITDRLDPGDIVRKLGEARLLTVASPEYLNRHGRPGHPSDLTGHRCLGYSSMSTNRPWVFSVDGELQNFFLPYCLQANNGDALAEAARQGGGIAVLPEFIVAELVDDESLEVILEEFEAPAGGVYALLPSNRYVPSSVRVLIDFLVAELDKPSAGSA